MGRGAARLGRDGGGAGGAGRLAEGRSVGGGTVGGAVKQSADLRPKRSGVGWRVEDVGPLVDRIAFADSPDWAAHGEAA